MCKRIPLPQGKFAIVDDENYRFLSQWTWSVSNGYAARRLRRAYEAGKKPRQRDQKMHRLIMGEPTGYQIDHINQNKLDNRKENLRLATSHQNRCNKPGRKPNGLKGITPRKDKWVAQIRSKDKHYYLGSFTSKKEAALAYDNAAIKLHGEFADLNFKQEQK